MKKAILAVMILFFLFGAISIASAEEIPITTCQDLNVEGTTYILQNNLNTNYECFDIDANNVTLDLNGFTIRTDNGAEFGVLVNHNNAAIIRNGSIEGFDSSVRIEHGDGNILENLSLKDSVSGVSLWESEENIISNNLIQDNSGSGVFISYSSGNLVEDNIIEFNTKAIQTFIAQETIINNNLIQENNVGIVMSESDENIIENNQILYNSRPDGGIYMEYSGNNSIGNNNISFNDAGITMQYSSYNLIHDNLIEYNEENGIYIEGSGYNTISDVQIKNTYDDGLYLDKTSSNSILNSEISGSGNNDFYIKAQNPLHCNNNLEGITWTEDREVEFWHNLNGLRLENLIAGGAIFCDVDNSEMSFLRIQNDDQTNGLIILLSENLELDRVKVKNTARGIRIENSQSVSLSRCSSESNNDFGLIIKHSTDIQVSDCEFNNNDEGGILLDQSSENELSDNQISNNEVGLWLVQAEDNYIVTSEINNNSDFGIYLEESSRLNTIRDNFIENNGNTVERGSGGGGGSAQRAGIFLDESSDNLIFNNLFNNNLNVLTDLFSANTWNDDVHQGQNIVGGPQIGGNYWAKPDGTGFSQICGDSNQDGFCNSWYLINPNNRDFYPLADWQDFPSPDADDDPVLGDADAPITMIEFGDFQDPFSARFWSQTLPQIRGNLINTGEVKYVFRDFPLTSIHPYAQKTAEASECAHEQGEYWEYHDKLYENYLEINRMDNLEEVISELKHYAEILELKDIEKFNECLDSGEMYQEIENDVADGESAGVSGTPNFFLQNACGQEIIILGAQSFGVFEEAIEDLSDGCTCPGDINGDGIVGDQDLIALLEDWDESNEESDINNDGIVDVQDLLILLNNWGECPGYGPEGAELEIEIDYVHTYNHETNQSGVPPADLTPDIYVGDSANPIGSIGVTIPLTQNNTPIIDGFSDGNVPGLHVSRGQDVNGSYIEFTSYGIHGGTARESIKFEVDLDNAIFTGVLNGAGTEHIYEEPTDGICGIIEYDPKNYIPYQDEYEVDIGGDSAEFCAVTRNGIDKVRVYYESELPRSEKITGKKANLDGKIIKELEKAGLKNEVSNKLNSKSSFNNKI